jgi:hypothetical protein
MVVQRRSRDPKKVEREERGLASARQRFDADPTPDRRRFLCTMIARYLQVYIRDGDALEKEIDAHLKEAATLLPAVIAHDKETRNPTNFRHGLSTWFLYRDICRSAGTQQAYATLKTLVDTLGPLVEGKPPYEIGSAHSDLGDIAVGLTGDLEAARKHYEEARKWRAREGREERPLDEWWPKENFDKLK